MNPNTADLNYLQNNNNVATATTLSEFVYNFKFNFLSIGNEIVPGLVHNQYEVIKRAYFYQHNQFESGPIDDNGQPKYFFDLMTDRNDQATKSIDLNTKDCYIRATNSGTYILSWLLRQEFQAYSKTTGFGMKLNNMASNLPGMGTVVWKKIKNEDGRVDVKDVDLINILNDPSVECLRDGIMIERHMLTQSELKQKGNAIDQTEVDKLIKSGRTSAPIPYMQLQGNYSGASRQYIDKTTPYYEVYELWGEIPYWMYMKYRTDGQKDPEVQGPDQLIESPYFNKSIYVMALVAGVEQGWQESILFCRAADKKKFPYEEVHYRRRKGRWLGVGNFELCFDQIVKANEVTNRFFNALRLALSHLYQTRDTNHVKNVLSDLLDGDVIVTKSAIEALPTEIRGLSEYKEEIERIENKCNHLCNTFEVVTGENLPSGTPFQLGQQMLNSASKLFEFVRQNCGLFIENVFNKWLLKDFAAQLTNEHILDMTNDPEDLKIYYDAIRKLAQYELIKKYILETEEYPTTEQLDLIGSLVKDQISNLPKQILVEVGTHDNTIIYGLSMDVTGENSSKKENLATLSTVLETLGNNPAALQDPRYMKILSIALEATGAISPLQLNIINSTPTNPLLNPGMQGGAPGAGMRSNISNQQPGATPESAVPVA